MKKLTVFTITFLLVVCLSSISFAKTTFTYDRFTNITTVSSISIDEIIERGKNGRVVPSVIAAYEGKTPSLPDEVIMVFYSRTFMDSKFVNHRKMYCLLDNTPFSIDYDEIQGYDWEHTGYDYLYLVEILTLYIPFIDLETFTKASKVEFKIGNEELEFTPEEMKEMMDFVKVFR